MMPIKDGIVASKEILDINPDISIYIVSSYNSFELAQKALKNKIKKQDENLVIDLKIV